LAREPDGGKLMILLYVALALQSPGDSISLDQALDRARHARGSVTAAAAGVAEARAALRTAGAIPNPTVSYSRTESTPRNHLLVDQSLDWLLRRGSDRSAARAGVDRALADSSLTVAGLLRDVRAAFYRARASRLAESLVRAQAALADSVARLAGARLRAGDISLLEQEQAAQEAARARQTAATAREAARVDEAELARAIAWEGVPPIPTGALDAGVDQLPDSAIDVETLPAVRTAAADSAVAVAQARAAARGRVPLPTVQSGAEWGDESQPGTLGVIGIAVPFPLWNLGGGTASAARARAARASALAREARFDAVRQIRQARIHLEETAARARFDRDSIVPGAALLRGRALRAYQAGETGIFPVLDALRGERDASLAAVQDQLAYQEALADWYALAGYVE
jgi:outer membrane protein, heavy metal efflux system